MIQNPVAEEMKNKGTEAYKQGNFQESLNYY